TVADDGARHHEALDVGVVEQVLGGDNAPSTAALLADDHELQQALGRAAERAHSSVAVAQHDLTLERARVVGRRIFHLRRLAEQAVDEQLHLLGAVLAHRFSSALRICLPTAMRLYRIRWSYSMLR